MPGRGEPGAAFVAIVSTLALASLHRPAPVAKAIRPMVERVRG